MPGKAPARRTVLKGAALAGTAGLGAAACSTESDLGHAENPTPTAPVDLGAASAVPAGSSKLFREQRLLVTCAEDGTYTALSAQCTHAGCVLDKIEGDEANCPCHGSRFSVTNGAAVKGPASVPLPKVPVRVENGKLIAGPKA
ncbi:Rieske (2Fe-2S) protein [Streptomyces indicus]|uniref:Cytochrome bc1 complex Rieske iron-sulfur subunit n=1 Tax=Streptomyces indicus TaxID=417292 RepID=A0A1G9FJL9_9ACTN|nr:Rieske (2Fe-2S) protein [Streptomyces indicus]SDK88537.1 Ferredoxin subunit of nitrite reductase or a ring-hydroxylating dioxygenase [Streptomyces indicus]